MRTTRVPPNAPRLPTSRRHGVRQRRSRASGRRAPLAVTVLVVIGVVGRTAVTPHCAPATFASFVATMICVCTPTRLGSPPVVVAGLLVE